MTSNPTIFEKAIGGQPAVRRGHPAADRRRAGARRRSSSSWRWPTCGPPATRSRRSTRRPAGGTAWSRSRSRPRWRTTPTATIHEAERLWRALDRPNAMIKIPGTGRGAARDHPLHRGRHQRQRHPALLGRAVRRGDRGVPRRARAPARGGAAARPIASVASFFVSRVDGKVDPLLDRAGDPAGAPRPDRHRQRLRGLPAVRVVARHAALGAAGPGRRPAAAAALGLDQHQGPALSPTCTTSRRWWRPGR